MKTTIIIFAHGSKNPDWVKPFEVIEHYIRQKLSTSDRCGGETEGEAEVDITVATAYLEYASPSMQDQIRMQIEAGVQKILIAPFFFGMGKHVKDDLARMISEAKNEHPTIQFEVLPYLGIQNEVLHAMADSVMGLALGRV